MSKLIIKTIEDKKIVWFQNSNSYLIFEPLVAEILSKINNGILVKNINKWCSKKIEIPKETISDFLKNVYAVYNENNALLKKKELKVSNCKVPEIFISEKFYFIDSLIFKIQFETEFHLLKVHPNFAHLEIESQPEYDFNYTIFNNEKSIVVLKNLDFIGKWERKEAHVFEGKLSMHLLIDIYKKPETDWMGVFHASAVSNGKESILVLGASGSGKSTSLALLNANEFDCIADDFVPIDNDKNIRAYPAAISIKKSGIKMLLPYYPELKNSIEYPFKKINKTVRFLPPKNINFDVKLKCKALVFIKYDSTVEIEITTVSKIEALQQLIPDSWISPIDKNVAVFLDWFLKLSYYQLTYSNNTKMTTVIEKIFNDEL